MKRGIDTNVLVYTHMPSLEQHERVRAFVLAQLADRSVTLVVTPSIIHELVHVITDSRRFEPPVRMSEALAVARGYLGRTNVECVSIDEESVGLALALIDRHRLGRNRIADTLLVATLLRHGVNELVTCNGADFETFEELALLDPCLP